MMAYFGDPIEINGVAAVAHIQEAERWQQSGDAAGVITKKSLILRSPTFMRNGDKITTTDYGDLIATNAVKLPSGMYEVTIEV